MVDAQILTQLVVVEFEGGGREAIGVEDIEIIRKPERPKKKKKQEDKEQPADDVEVSKQPDGEENDNGLEAEQ